MLMFEFIKSTRQGKSFVEHFLALLLAGGAAAEFWMVREAGNSTFLLFVVICFVDLFAGFAASLRRARRAVVVEPEPVAGRRAPSRRASSRSRPSRRGPSRRAPNPFTRVEPAPRAEPVITSSRVQKSSPCARSGSCAKAFPAPAPVHAHPVRHVSRRQ